MAGSAEAGEAVVAAFCCPELFETTESLLQAALREMASSAINNLIRDTFACEFIMTFMILPECNNEVLRFGRLYLFNSMQVGRKKTFSFALSPEGELVACNKDEKNS